VAAQYSPDSVRICNHTELDFYEVHLSPAGERLWLPDGPSIPDPGPLDNVFRNGTCRTIYDVPPGRYDLELDFGGDECVASSIPIYQNRVLDLTMGWLLENCD